MGFIMEFARHLVLKMMEDPEERDKKFREHVYAVKDRCAKTKEMWSLPMRPYGFWTFERHNSQLAWDAQISQVEGRRDPYDDALQQFSGKIVIGGSAHVEEEKGGRRKRRWWREGKRGTRFDNIPALVLPYNMQNS
ncbi:hypothetical protein Ahy_B01g053128 [Arachis hypogaea]|uniref:Uncharacterized protein n=1 Tax=Arachis hypogaea TaxID=3818 RepID=A0A445AR42_ARAHY|nr:hypothetical protein Ahy_B01g053128 [Arachis hypogaea]